MNFHGVASSNTPDQMSINLCHSSWNESSEYYTAVHPASFQSNVTVTPSNHSIPYMVPQPMILPPV